MYDNINFTIPTDLLTYRLIWGMRIILKYEQNARIVIGQHDTIYFGSYDQNIDMEDLQQLIEWGWYEEEEAWAFNV